MTRKKYIQRRPAAIPAWREPTIEGTLRQQINAARAQVVPQSLMEADYDAFYGAGAYQRDLAAGQLRNPADDLKRLTGQIP